MWFNRQRQDNAAASKGPGFFRRQLGRYTRESIGGTVKEQRRNLSWIARLIRDLNDQPTGTTDEANLEKPDTWDEAALYYGYHLDKLRANYVHWARLAKAFLGASVASVLILLHRLLAGDWGGVLASTAALLILVGLALKPAHRCWQIRTRTLSEPKTFLRDPANWWPVDLPADYRPYRTKNLL